MREPRLRGKCLHFLLDFSVSLKLLPKIKSIKIYEVKSKWKKCKEEVNQEEAQLKITTQIWKHTKGTSRSEVKLKICVISTSYPLWGLLERLIIPSPAKDREQLSSHLLLVQEWHANFGERPTSALQISMQGVIDKYSEWLNFLIDYSKRQIAINPPQNALLHF